MIIVKKIDTKEKTATISNNGKLQTVKLSEFLTEPKVNDMVDAQKDENGKVKLVVVSETEATATKAGSKSKIVAGLLGIFFGALGVHNFYLGYTGKAIAQLLITLIGAFVLVGPMISSIWALIESICILASKKGNSWHKDGYGRELTD